MKKIFLLIGVAVLTGICIELFKNKFIDNSKIKIKVPVKKPSIKLSVADVSKDVVFNP